jgi:dihydropteroate synthase
MGILNIGENSFFDGGKYTSSENATIQCEKLIAEGADIVDIGAASSKPGEALIDASTEIEILNHTIRSLPNQFPDTVFSIDTYNSETALWAVANGFRMINDISFGEIDSKMLNTAAHLDVPYIGMHMKGTPKTMQLHTHYDDFLTEVFDYFNHKISIAKSFGIKDIIIDPGFGFAKTIAQNFKLLHHLALFNTLGMPILAGLSRKSTIYKTLHTTPDKALNGTTALNMIALQNAASILRVHDVKEAKECVTLHQSLIQNA